MAVSALPLEFSIYPTYCAAYMYFVLYYVLPFPYAHVVTEEGKGKN